METAHGENTGLIDRARLTAIRPVLQQQLAPFATYFSVDGKTFGFEAPISIEIPVGGYVSLTTRAGTTYLGQIIVKEVVAREGPELRLDVRETASADMVASGLSEAIFKVRLRAIEGSGVLLGRATLGAIVPTTSADTFDDADMSLADNELLVRYLASHHGSHAGLDVGSVAHSDGSARSTLRAAGFNRHTFLCGQSGSGKTFSLGVLLERVLMETDLRIVIIDPNSDFVRLPQMRTLAEHNRTRRTALSPDEFASVSDRYQEAAQHIRILGPSGDTSGAEPLRVRFSDLNPHEQATVLKIDPLSDRGEYSSFVRIIDTFGERSYSLNDIEAAALRDLSTDGRQLALRIGNLGVANWGVWGTHGDLSATSVLEDDWRALIVDVGGFASASERAVVALAVLDFLWKHRNDRTPTLIVIDEAHNVCPQENADPLLDLAAQHVIRIAGEGRKFGLYLLLATQRPAKIHANALSQSDNLILMRTNSSTDLAHIMSLFSQVPPSLVEQAAHFRQGETLFAGGIVPSPLFARIEGRLSHEGGSDVPTDWAR